MSITINIKNLLHLVTNTYLDKSLKIQIAKHLIIINKIVLILLL